MELPTIPEKNSGEILSDTDDDDDDVPQPEVMPVGPALVPSQPTGDEFLPWHSPFDYFSHGGGRSPSAITHKQFNEVPDPVIFANQGPIYDFWNSAEEYSWFSDDLPESPLAIQSPDDEQSIKRPINSLNSLNSSLSLQRVCACQLLMLVLPPKTQTVTIRSPILARTCTRSVPPPC